MSAKFEIYENPGSKLSQKKTYQARIVEGRTVEQDELAELIQKRCTVNAADTIAVLTALSEVMVEVMKEGNRIHMAEVGYFSLALSCTDAGNSDKPDRQAVKLKTVKFQAERQLKKRLEKSLRLEQSRKGSSLHSRNLTHEEIAELLTGYFKENTFITRQKFEELCGFRKSTALNHINRLIDEKVIRNAGTRNQPVYMPVADNTKRN
ncbi:hypothetical protein [Bacteroides ilei]|jgi:predicted histone-like DNA-binding protein|uniref:HU family DNA-binding protein n=1 Tax=Bacteroides ilei TaxID=1907658 RepID=UPI000930C9A8|nr:hypothetical protein [Bacteroides ilei]